MSELKRKYEQAMRDVLHILGKYDYQYIKEYVEDLEKTFIQLEQSYDKLWDSVNHNPPLKFEEIKEEDVIFDKDFEGGKWIRVFAKFDINDEEKAIAYRYFGSPIIRGVAFKEGRFYRKQVEE